MIPFQLDIWCTYTYLILIYHTSIHKQPIPRKSFLEIDFQKDRVDTLVIHRYMSERMMREDGHKIKPYTSLVSPELLIPSASPEARQNLLDWVGDNAQAIDAAAVNEKFHEAGLLQHDERVAFAFKTGRDSLYLTNKRLFVIDVQVRMCLLIFSLSYLIYSM